MIETKGTCRPSGALDVCVFGVCRSIRAINMSPLWGFKTICVSRAINIAPLGLKAESIASDRSAILGFLAQWVGGPNPYGFNRAVASWFFIRAVR